MKFYNYSQAVSPRRVRMFLAEKGIDIPVVNVDLGNGEQFSDDFRRINPDTVVPALELSDGTVITEVVAICDYLEALHPEPSLLGTTPQQRAEVLMWNAKAEQQGLWAMMDRFRNHAKGFAGRALPGPVGYEQIPALAERSKLRVEAFHQRLNERLAQSEFVGGPFYSLADITAQATVDFATRGNIPMPEDAEHEQRWYAAVSSRPSAGA